MREERELIKQGTMDEEGRGSFSEEMVRALDQQEEGPEQVRWRWGAWISIPEDGRVLGVTIGRGGWVGVLERSLEVRKSR